MISSLVLASNPAFATAAAAASQQCFTTVCLRVQYIIIMDYHKNNNNIIMFPLSYIKRLMHTHSRGFVRRRCAAWHNVHPANTRFRMFQVFCNRVTSARAPSVNPKVQSQFCLIYATPLWNSIHA